jgi:hypothetical protein
MNKTNWGRLLTLGALSVVVLGGVAFGVNFLWQKQFGPTTASTADCRLAQELIDKARTAPRDDAEAERWEQAIRQIRYTRLKDDGISTQVGKYVAWSRAKATGKGELPTTKQFEDMKDEAIGHCDDSDVNLTIPAIGS